MAWQDNGGGDYEIYIKRWNGSSWVEIGAGSASGGGISNNSAASSEPSLALDSSGNPVVAWYDGSGGNYEIYIKRWDGSNWVDIGANSSSGGGISNNSGTSAYPSLALDSSGNPVVAWADDSGGNFDIYIKRWNGSSWVEVGAGSATGGGISNNSGASDFTSLALDSSGNPVVSWRDNSGGDTEIYIKRWDGSSWADIGLNSSSVGGISNNSGVSAYPSLAIDSSDNPAVTWEDSSGGADTDIFIKRPCQ